jgi:nitrilase
VNQTKVGCTICYDLRFSELFQLYYHSNVKIIMVPASFNEVTGKAHWEILCRARAIETQSYLIAPAQVGEYQEGNHVKRSWGHSMIIDPWGNIIAKLEESIGFSTAHIDTNLVDTIRFNMPMRS